MAMEQSTDPVFEALGMSDQNSVEQPQQHAQQQMFLPLCPQTMLQMQMQQQMQLQQQVQQQMQQQMQQQVLAQFHQMIQQPQESCPAFPFPQPEAMSMLAAAQAAAAAAYFPQASTSLLLPDVLPAAPMVPAPETQVLLPVPWVPQVPMNWATPTMYQNSDQTAQAVANVLMAPQPDSEADSKGAAPATPPRKQPTSTEETPEKVILNMAERLEQLPPMVLKLSEVMDCGSPASTCTPGSKATEDMDATPASALRQCMATGNSEKAAAGQMLLQLLKGSSENLEAETAGASTGAHARRRRRGGRGRGRGAAGNDTPSTAASDGESHAASQPSVQEPTKEQRLAETSRELLRQLKGPTAGSSSGEVKTALPAVAPSRTRRAKNGEPRSLQ